MAVTLHCPRCSTEFKVRNDAAGTTATCPECGKKVPVPGGDEPPAPARRRPPQDEDERPTRRPARRDADDDRAEGPPNKSKVGLVLGIVGGVLLLGCGTCGGIGYYLYSKGKAAVNNMVADIANEKVTTENAERLTAGMTHKEVEAILGTGKRLDRLELASLTDDPNQGGRGREYEKFWGPWVDRGLVYRWRNGLQYVMVAYNDPPDAGGKLKGLSYRTIKNGSLNSFEKIPMPVNPAGDADAVRLGMAAGPAGGGGKVTIPAPAGGGGTVANPAPAGPMAAAALARAGDQQKGQKVSVAGTIVKGEVLPGGGGRVHLDGLGEGRTVRLAFDAAAWGRILSLAPGDTLTAGGTCDGVSEGRYVDVSGCQVTQSSTNAMQATASAMAREFATNPGDAEKKYKGKVVRLGGFVKEFKDLDGLNTVVLRGNPDKKGARVLVISCDYAADWKDLFQQKKAGDRITVIGRVSGLFEDKIVLNGCWVVP